MLPVVSGGYDGGIPRRAVRLNGPENLHQERGTVMFLRYLRYTFATLATVAFGLTQN
jgi:hypothetical protein